MAKNKSLKQKEPGGERSSSAEDEEPDKIKTKKRRTHVEVEEAPVQIPCVTNPEEETSKKEKKQKKARRESGAELPHRASCPEGTQEGDRDLTPEEKRVLERKLKKIRKKEERKRLKADGEAKTKTPEPGPSASKLALEYLTCWAESRSAWKFQKLRQTWLLQHMYDSDKIPDDTFAVLLQYLEGLCGNAKETTVQKAMLLVEESGKAPEDKLVQQRAQRAREVIQLFS